MSRNDGRQVVIWLLSVGFSLFLMYSAEGLCALVSGGSFPIDFTYMLLFGLAIFAISFVFLFYLREAPGNWVHDLNSALFWNFFGAFFLELAAWHASEWIFECQRVLMLGFYLVIIVTTIAYYAKTDYNNRLFQDFCVYSPFRVGYLIAYAFLLYSRYTLPYFTLVIGISIGALVWGILLSIRKSSNEEIDE